MPGARPRLLAYSHDGYGLGHFRRNLRIAVGLRRHRPDVEVLLATGAKAAERLASAQGIACVHLPSVIKAGPGRYESTEPGETSVDAVVARRSAILAETVTDFAPNILLVDRHPRGLHRELDAALDIHRSRRPLTRAVLGLRDILDEPETVEREWDQQELTSAIEDHYDAVFCYGDRGVYDPVAEYGLPGVVADRLQYTGYLTDDLLAPDAASIRRLHAGGARLAICTLGGGQDATGIAGAFLAAMLHLRERNWRGVLITGPYMAPNDVEALRNHDAAADVAIITMATDVPSYLAAADIVFCMGGYNTTCEVLGLAVPAVIVPRTSPRLEQLMRAQRLADRGLVHWLHPDGLTPRVVAGALAYVADTPQDDLLGRMTSLAHTGVHTTALLLSELLPRATTFHLGEHLREQDQHGRAPGRLAWTGGDAVDRQGRRSSMTRARHSEAQRVVVLVKRFPRLSETFILNEFLELRRHGLPVELFAIMDPNERRSQPEALALVPEVTYLQTGRLWGELPAALRAARRYPWGTMRTAGWALTRHTRAAGRNLLHALVLLDRLASGPPAHLHAHFLHSPAALAFIAAKVSGQPYSLTGHAKDIYTTLPENLRMRCARARFVTTCTEANRTHLIKEVGLEPGQIHVCRHGVDLAKFTIPARQPRPGRIVSVGRLVPKKGFDILIQACGDLGRRGVAFELVLLGGGELHDELLALAREQGIGDRVTLLGSRPQSDVVEQLAAAEIFALSPVVLPDGDRDGVPNVLLEAMAVGVPVVATTVSGIPEVVTDGETGRLVPPQRPDLLADALAQLLTDPAGRTPLGEAGRRFVHEHASWTSAIAPLVDLLEGELARPTRRPNELTRRPMTRRPNELTMSQQG